MEPCVAVYSADTLDLINGAERPGGPRFYAERAARLLGGFRVERGCIADPPAVFAHEEHGGRRLSRLLRAPGPCRPLWPPCGAGLVSPVYWEASPGLVADAARLHRVLVVDVQGFVRVPRGGGLLGTDARLLGVLASLPAEGVVFRASFEDLGYSAWGLEVMDSVLAGWARVVTMGALGAVYAAGREVGSCILEGGEPDRPSVGAGDVFSTALAYLLVKGVGLGEAVCRAARVAGLHVVGREPGARLLRLPGGHGLLDAALLLAEEWGGLLPALEA